ncbi:MAG: hypothetical protein DRJ61_17885, partial [Acidobacteria bacterium]
MLRPEIIFLNLFLNLLAGTQPIEVLVPGEVEIVELRLDGVTVASRTTPPWSFTVDLGNGILPHRLTAVAVDSAGNSVAETSRLINLGLRSADCRLVPEIPGRTLSLVCKSVTDSKILNAEILMDGRRVDLNADWSIPLPQDGGAHLVSATVEFDGGDVVREEAFVSTGGGASLVSDLTAVTARFKPSEAEISPENIQARHRETGAPLQIRAIERGKPLVVAIVSREARRRLAMQEILTVRTEREGRRRATHGSDVLLDRVEELESSVGSPDWVNPILRQVDPVVDPQSGDGLAPSLFPMTDPVTLGLQSFRQLSVGPWEQGKDEIQRISDALVVAGALATAEKSPRTVLLIIYRDDEDESWQTPDQALTYLNALGVPLVIWTTGGRKGVESQWGQATKVIDRTESMIDAAEDLNRFLSQEWVVWVEGSWLPGEVGV